MADENTQDETPVETEAETDQTDAGDVPAEVKKALAKANKEAETYRLRLKEIEDRDKSEIQKAAERAEAAEKRATEAEGKALRAEVAHAKGLTAAQAKRLQGTTREELEADADELLNTFAPAKPERPKPTRLSSGSGSDVQKDGKERAAEALRRMGSGR